MKTFKSQVTVHFIGVLAVVAAMMFPACRKDQPKPAKQPRTRAPIEHRKQASTEQAAPPANAVLSVGEEYVGRAELEREMARLNRFHNATVEQMNTFRERALENLVERKLVEIAAYREDVTTTPEELEKQWQEAVRSKGGASRLTQFLEAERFTEDEYRGLVANRLLRKKLRDRYFNEPITKDQIRAHFESTKEQPGRGNKVRVSRILLRVDKTALESKWQEAESRIAEIRAEIEAGLPFAEAVGKYSEGPYAKRNGDLGWATDRRRPFTTFGPALTMQVGEYHGPIRSKTGVELITVTERKNDAPGNLEQETPRIRQILSEQRDRRNDKRLIQLLRSQYRIEILQ